MNMDVLYINKSADTDADAMCYKTSVIHSLVDGYKSNPVTCHTLVLI